MTKHKCAYPGCQEPYFSKDYCTAHYFQLRRTGKLHPITEPAAAKPKRKKKRRGLKPLPADHPMRAALALPTERERVDALIELKGE